MPRLTTIDPASATGKVKEIFDGPLNGKHLNIFKSMANSPAALQFYLSASGALASAELSKAEQEIIQLAVGQANGCNYCLAAHTAIGKSAGLTEEQTVQARSGTLPDAKLAALASLGAALVEKKGWLSDDDVASFKSAGYTDTHLAEAIAVFALATFTNYFNHVNETEVDFPAAPSI